MKKVTLETYKQDKYYSKIVKAISEILSYSDVVAPVEVFIRMHLLKKEDVENWRFGRISYLERVIQCNLSKANRILRIIRFHVHDLNMIPKPTIYRKWGKGRKHVLRFSKSGNANLEEAYSRHYLWNQKKKMEVLENE